MNTHKYLAMGIGFVALLGATTQAQVVETFNNPVNASIPDNYPGTLSFVSSVLNVASSINSIGRLDVNLQITGNGSSPTDGGWIGDYYVSLTHDSTSVVLLNRVGRGDSVSLQVPEFGYADIGMNITLSDSADPTRDIHTYHLTLGLAQDTRLNSPLTGTWAPDGRTTSPGSVTVSDPRTSTLSSFNAMDPNGIWTLNVFDYSPSYTSTLNNWGLTFTAVPEPRDYALICSIGLAGFGFYRRFFRLPSPTKV